MSLLRRCSLSAALVVSALCLPASSAAARAAADTELAGWIARGLLDEEASLGAHPARLAAEARRTDLELATRASGILTRAGITSRIVSSSGGVIELRGEAAHDESHALAVAQVAALPGVSEVRDHLRRPGAESASVEPAAPAAEPVAPAPFGAYTEAFAFLASHDRAGRGIVIAVTDGVVELHGEVNSEAARRHVVAVAQRLPGVRAVRTDALAVRAADRAADHRLALLLTRRLEQDPAVAPVARAVLVTVQDGVARLSGQVADEVQASHARALVAGISEVFALRDELAVNPRLVVASR